MERKKIIELAQLLKLIPTEEVISSLEQEFSEIENMLNEFNKINVDNVQPLARLSDVIELNLREDIPENKEQNKQIILNNASESNEDFVKIERVIND
ncbi:Asp-tRNA(Asn)/Glu-tRNA(Gln) amidotransferase subunit GatC [Mesomycoplasma lagogenitalium]|uniref:Aspartyl/glutamyl-tRNA(Asn/Gln) amidotransferase subunit C n=1 Tax=Mesomycoplasma lagogenitalium TaxID=171286 RepID=A0ABY8LTF5_9BACT|nr:hypothetical protein [Mesomycoplasma lagogenitalium]WGI36527.1 hypothetical protein QEG99_03615 [Mesomycoplasma lagogenitalium]